MNTTIPEHPVTPDEMPPPRRLSVEIEALVAALKEGPVTLREIIAVIHGRAYTMLLILLSLPFCLPVPIPGLSTALGAIIAIIGLRLSLRAAPWLPDAVLDAKVSSTTVGLMLRGSQRVARAFEVLLRPRWCVLVDYVVLHHFYGAMIFISGVLLLLPLPIPFSNLIPALTIIFLAGALLERDGYFIIAGVIMFILTLAFFGGIFLGGAAMIHWLKDWFGGGYDPQEMLPPDFPLPPDFALPVPGEPMNLPAPE